MISVILAAVVEVLLRTSSLSLTARVLQVSLVIEAPVAPFRSEPMPRWSRARMRAVDVVAGRWPFGDTCLRRALLTAVVLRRMQPSLRVGWRSSVVGGNAHAWVEVAGRSLDPELAGITVFTTR